MPTKKVKHTEPKLQLKPAGLCKYVWSFSVRKTLKGLMLEKIKDIRNKLWSELGSTFHLPESTLERLVIFLVTDCTSVYFVIRNLELHGFKVTTFSKYLDLDFYCCLLFVRVNFFIFCCLLFVRVNFLRVSYDWFIISGKRFGRFHLR